MFKYIDQIPQGTKVHPGIERIVEYDKKQGTQLYETLVLFLKKDGNTNEVAKQLHVHVNTLTYRIKRLESIGRFLLKDPAQRMGLYLDLLLTRK